MQDLISLCWDIFKTNKAQAGLTPNQRAKTFKISQNQTVLKCPDLKHLEKEPFTPETAGAVCSQSAANTCGQVESDYKHRRYDLYPAGGAAAITPKQRKGPFGRPLKVSYFTRSFEFKNDFESQEQNKVSDFL